LKPLGILEMDGQRLAAYPVAEGARPVRDLRIRGLVPAILLSFALVAALTVHSGLTVRLDARLLAILSTYAVVAGGATLLSRIRPTPRSCICADAVRSISLFAGVCLFGALASYPVAESSRGFADIWLERFDATVGFNWLAWYELVAHHPLLQAVERAAYESIFLIPAIILGYFAFAGRQWEATRFIMAFWLAAMMTLAAFYLVPTIGPFAVMAHGHVPYMPISALYQAQIIPELRVHRLHQVPLDAMHGLVGAPSFHAASAVLFIAAARSSRSLRWPLTLLSVAMLFATPVEGTHYLGDVFAGMLVALIALGLTTLLTEGRTTRRERSTPSR
jgi:hypothetical protein